MARHPASSPPPEDDQFLIVFDRGDVAWLRGYCNILMGVAECMLGYNWEELFNSTAQMFFRKAETPYAFLKANSTGTSRMTIGDVNILDAIAFVHLLRVPVADATLLRSAHGHFSKVPTLSRESWSFIQKETDEDHEWIPNPAQTSVTGARVSTNMIEEWVGCMTEIDALLNGTKLLPFWRGDDGRGVNLRKVFLEPRPFDLVLWVQGTAAAPYLEQGTVTDRDVWNRLEHVLGSDLVGFAIWFN